MKMVISKKKGNLWENKLAHFLQSHGIKAWKDSASGGGSLEKADIGNNLGLHIECKAVKKINLKQVWDKAELECSKTHNSPLLAIHFDSMPDNTWLMVLHSDDYVDLIKSKGIAPAASVSEHPNDREKKWALERVKTAINAALKLME